MKKLNVSIQLEMSVPDDWELATTSEGTPVLKLPNGQYMDIAIEPLFASNPEETWTSTDNEDTLNDILDMVESEAVACPHRARPTAGRRVVARAFAALAGNGRCQLA